MDNQGEGWMEKYRDDKQIPKLKSSRFLSALFNQDPNLSEGGNYLEQVRD